MTVRRAREANSKYGGTGRRDKSSAPGFKVFIPCAEMCYLREQGLVEYIVSGPTLYRAKDGTHRGNSCTWYTFRCNCSGCPGLAGMRWDVLAKTLAFGLNARTRFGK